MYMYARYIPCTTLLNSEECALLEKKKEEEDIALYKFPISICLSIVRPFAYMIHLIVTSRGSLAVHVGLCGTSRCQELMQFT